MTMNTKPKMTAEQRLQRAMERNEAELQKAEEKRKQLLQRLQLPGHMTANALLEALNLLMTREEFDAL